MNCFGNGVGGVFGGDLGGEVEMFNFEISLLKSKAEYE
jgi:hypothetical protein